MTSCYIHIPFCEKICSYCDFCKLFYNERLVDQYLEKLEEEILTIYEGEELETIYIGGGTPSSLNLQQLEKLFSIIDGLNKKSDIEFTVECNFLNTDLEKLKLFKRFGVNRLSFGLETINHKQLSFLERDESKERTINIIKMARELGFNNINVDLMYALPGESLVDLNEDLDFIYSLDVEHISCYSLIIEEHTKLGIKNVENISEDLDFKMYEEICCKMKKHDFLHYEISNYAKKGYYSKHNTVYWENKEYYGFGLGASSFRGNRRISNTKSINKYLAGDYVFEEEYLEKDDFIYYEIMLNLRKSEGIDLDKLYSKYKVRLECEELVKLGLVCKRENRLYIPEEKWYISNDIIIRLLEGVVYE